MHKVFFADDEAAMRTGIRNNIDWESSGFTLVGEAPDGELALSLMSEMMPDILITDVRMPFMDGIALSRHAKKAMPWIKILILSGHDEFEYAKQAITIGVEEYLLKPVTSESLMNALNKVAKKIEREKEESRNIEKLVNDIRQVQAERLLSGLLYGSAEPETALRQAKELNIFLSAEHYLIMLIELHVLSTASYSLLQSACACALGILAGWDNAVFFNQGLDRIVCVLKGTDEAALEEEAYTYAQAVKHGVERSIACSVTVAIGTIVSGLDEWPRSFSDADMARRYLNLANRGQIISIQDIRSGGLMDFKEAKKLPVEDKLRYVSRSDIPRFLDDYFTGFGDMSATSFMFLNYIFVDILMASSKLIEELGGDMNEVLTEYLYIDGILATNSDAGTVRETLVSILERTIDFRDSLAGSKYNDVITGAQEYIRLNFAQQGLSLNSVAKAINLSPNHFSTIFSQETGETFISYLTRIRLDHAKTLLRTTNMRPSDVAYAVGYNDTHYFSHVFKKATGMPPKEFRK